jgi:hypothetical protein
MVDAPIAGVSATIIARRLPITQGWAPPQVVLHHRLGDSSCTDAPLGSFLYHDVGLCMLTGVGPWFPHQVPPHK